MGCVVVVGLLGWLGWLGVYGGCRRVQVVWVHLSGSVYWRRAVRVASRVLSWLSSSRCCESCV